LVAYPILDLNRLGLRIHPYMRLLEDVVIATVASFGIEAGREEGATGVWVSAQTPEARKIAALGVRLSRWCSMHGLALNVEPDLDHFQLIVPCGLSGRPVTSLRRELGDECPSMSCVRDALEKAFNDAIDRLEV
jgi:lipoyl(octanoyl) transferase